MTEQRRLPDRLVRARLCVVLFLEKFVDRYMKGVARAHAAGFNEIFCRIAKSPAWEMVCNQVFDQYVGQLSFTPLKQIHLVAEKLHITSESCVLELAPGTGGLSVYLAKLTGCRLIGQDASCVAVKAANSLAISQGLDERVCFHLGVLPDLEYKDGSFDVIVCIDSIYAVADKATLFRGCYRVLQPSGRLGFFTLYRLKEFSSEDAMRARANSWLPLQPYHQLLERAGFKDVLRTDFTEDLILLAKEWVRAMQGNKAALYKEIGGKVTEGLLDDFRTAWILSADGFLGRGLFQALKPCS